MKQIFFLIAGLLIFFNLSAQVAKGRVFEDTNSNGILDKGEKGIAQVAVSNGSAVVLTDKGGNYVIDVPDNALIFVIKPSDYRNPYNALYLPQFFYRHYPNGGPDLKDPGISATGPLPAEINFGLIPGKKESTFKAVIFGDTQIASLSDLDYLGQDIVAELTGDHDLTFGAILGDIVHENFSLYEPLNQMMSAMQIPMHNVQGNHDMNYYANQDKWASESFKLIYGPRNYAFNYGDVHFIVLDNILYSGDSIRRDYVEGFDQEAITFVRNDLKHVPDDRLIVLMTHAPFINEYTSKPIVNLDRILDELARFPHTFSISGHNHTVSQHLIGKESGWKGAGLHHHFITGASCGNWWSGLFDEAGIPDATMYDGTPNGYAVASFDGNSYRIDYKVARRPSDIQMNIHVLPAAGDSSVSAGTGEIYVNFFTGSERDQVSIRFDDQQEMAMKRVIEPDPGYTGQYRLWENPDIHLNGRPMPEPQPSLHLWKVIIPAGLKTGLHKAEVTAGDLFGRKFKAVRFFRVSD